MGITTKVETITPAKAEAYLKGNKKNRKVRRSVVQKYASAMSKGQWRLNHQGLGFNGDGTLYDGQHRLLAVIESGKSVKMLVTRGLEKDSMFGCDIGKNRDLVDVATIAGVDMDITRTHVSTARAMIDGIKTGAYGIGSSSWSFEDLISYIRTHWSAIEFAMNLELGAMSSACVRAVAARAYYSVDHATLEEFFQILATGVTKSQAGMWPIKLREYLLTFRNPGGGFSLRRSLYAKTERALTKFVDVAPFTRLREVLVEAFALPGEEVAVSCEDD